MSVDADHDDGHDGDGYDDGEEDDDDDVSEGDDGDGDDEAHNRVELSQAKPNARTAQAI